MWRTCTGNLRTGLTKILAGGVTAIAINTVVTDTLIATKTGFTVVFLRNTLVARVAPMTLIAVVVTVAEGSAVGSPRVTDVGSTLDSAVVNTNTDTVTGVRVVKCRHVTILCKADC